MPRTKTYRSLGVNVAFSVDDNPFDVGSRNYKIFEAGVDNVIYRGASGLAKFRELFADAVEKATGISPEMVVLKNKKGEERKNEDGTPITDFVLDEQERVNVAVAKSGRTIESFQEVANACASQCGFDPDTKERAPAGPKTPPERVYKVVDKLFEAGKASEVAAALSTLLGRTVDVTGDQKVAREVLAAAVHEDQLNEIRKAAGKWGA
jgi:hypothetical protein